MPAPLRSFLVVALTCTLLSLTLSAWRAWTQGTHFGADGLWFADPGFDYWVYYPRYLHRHSIDFFFFPAYPWYYPAPALFCLYPFFAAAHRLGSVVAGYWIFGVMTSLGAVGLCIGLARALRRAGLAQGPTRVFCTLGSLTVWPIYFAIQRGNIEGLTWVLLALGIWALVHQRPAAAAVLLGAVGSAKLYPLIFGALLLRRALWRYLVLMVLAATITTVLSLHLMMPSVRVAWFWVRDGIQHFTVTYGEVYHDPEWDHSLFGLFKDLTHTHRTSYHGLLGRYYLIAGLPASLLYLLRVQRFPFLNRIIFLTCGAVCLPPTSFDYTLCLVYIPLALLAVACVKAGKQAGELAGASLAMGFFGLLLAPTTFLYTKTMPFLPGAAKTLCLLALMLLASSRPLITEAAAEELVA